MADVEALIVSVETGFETVNAEKGALTLPADIQALEPINISITDTNSRLDNKLIVPSASIDINTSYGAGLLEKQANRAAKKLSQVQQQERSRLIESQKQQETEKKSIEVLRNQRKLYKTNKSNAKPKKTKEHISKTNKMDTQTKTTLVKLSKTKETKTSTRTELKQNN